MIRIKRLHSVISIFLTIVMIATWLCQVNTSVPLQASEPSSVVQPRVYAPEDEIVNERTENAKKFYLGENLYALDVSIGAIHYKDNYQDQTEQWKDIDLTFDENNRITKAPYELTVDSANYSLTVKDKKTGQITTLKMTKVGDQETKDIKKASNISKGKILWQEVADDLDVAITADNTRVRFDWIVKSENAPHEVEFEIDDGGIPILYRGVDAEGEMVAVTAEKTGNKIIEKIEKGGKYPIIINPSIEFQISASTNDGTINTWGEEYYYPDLASNWVGFYGYQYYGTYFQYHSWYRWTGFTIPAGSTINSNSYISLYADNTPSYRPETIIYFDNEASPSYPTGVSDYLYRPLTSNYVPFSPGIWTYQTWYYSDSIQNILQELVNSYGSISVLQCMHQDCTPFINYIVKILKNGAYDTSAIYSPKIHIEYSPPPPAAPTGVSATDGTYSDKVQITWTASSGATSYKVYRHTSNDSGSASLIGTPSTTSFDDTSAVAGTTYYYWVKATNSSGDSGFSSQDTGWRAALPPPAAPTNVSATDGTYTTYVRITWTASSGATGYKIFRNTWNDSDTASQIGTDTASPYYDYSATPGTTYYYWMKAYNANGDSVFSSSNSGWRKLTAPTGVSASDGKYSDKVRISWTASTGATSYKVYRNTTSSSGTATQIGTIAASPYEDTTATAEITYYYWVKASCANGDSAFSGYNTGWRTVAAPPAAPTSVHATDGGYNDEVGITWTESTGATSYKVYRNTTNYSPTQIGTTSATYFDDTSAIAGTSYYYWVKATNSAGDSDFSGYDIGWYAFVGDYWVSQYLEAGVLTNSEVNAEGFVNILNTNGWAISFNKGDEGPVTESDFQGTDTGPNSTNIFWFQGHGLSGKLILKNSLAPLWVNDCVRYYDVQWGNLLKWAFLHACHTLQDDDSGQGMNTPVLKTEGQFSQSLDGCHMICGADTIMKDWDISVEQNGQVTHTNDGTNVANRLVNGYPILSAWTNGCDQYYSSSYTLRVIAEDSSYWNEYLPGQGSGPAADVSVDDYYVSYTYYCAD